MKDRSWRIYIVGHERLYDEAYEGDKRFGKEHYTYLNVGSNNKIENLKDLECINQKDLPNNVSLGKWWTESEGIYNIWRSGIYKELEYIGFVHYDFIFRLIKRTFPRYRYTNITARIDKYLKKKEKVHISFFTFDIRKDYAQKILADKSKPDILCGDGYNCYDYILNDYNTFFHTNYTLEDLLSKEIINLCSCFLIDVDTFDKMMKFWDWIVQSHKLECFDTQHQYRLQGGLAERYFGIFLALESERKDKLDLTLSHVKPVR